MTPGRPIPDLMNCRLWIRMSTSESKRVGWLRLPKRSASALFEPPSDGPNSSGVSLVGFLILGPACAPAATQSQYRIVFQDHAGREAESTRRCSQALFTTYRSLSQLRPSSRLTSAHVPQALGS